MFSLGTSPPTWSTTYEHSSLMCYMMEHPLSNALFDLPNHLPPPSLVFTGAQFVAESMITTPKLFSAILLLQMEAKYPKTNLAVCEGLVRMANNMMNRVVGKGTVRFHMVDGRYVTLTEVVKLKAFSKFENTSEALSAATLLIDSKPSKGLRKFLRAHCDGETLAVADSKLGNAIKEKLDLAPMSLGLSHSLSRYKLKFSPDKVDTMIIQAIGLLDDLDKELNTYAMRVREWYGWHFPELAKIVQDNILYAKAAKLMGNRTNAAKLDFSEILPEDVETELKEAAMISMGTEVSDLDLMNIKELCDQVLSLSEYRAQLYDYLKSRMNTIAPNLTALVGELVGARLIAHGGSLLNLAKQPGSTVQILGAEKALFRALKTKHATPKYGLIYHASLIGQAAPKHKGKISRSLAAKTALAIRYDALGDNQDNSMGLENRAKLEARLRNLEGRELSRSAGSAKGKPKIEFYDKDRKNGAGAMLTPAKAYNPSADSILGRTESAVEKEEEMAPKKRKSEDERSQIEEVGEEAPDINGAKKEKKKKEEEGH
ncbi:NOP56-like pre RNA processing ribonucleoprotein [Actinidia rufa]|uniref:NOP56-like pre RNA processing ribonucleoprotein n=1 Tax=Actinidia rufa TaxID=165716 RepID=A0A7J0EW58_9ERIC|nr:NOP56-like pre RNA processing ribonucleoprotein [Actinidia rufa]